jgi:hypothetical protein
MTKPELIVALERLTEEAADKGLEQHPRSDSGFATSIVRLGGPRTMDKETKADLSRGE